MELSKLSSRSAMVFTLAVLSSASFGFSAASATHTIVIEGMKFVPETLAIKSGDTIIWENRDFLPHTVTSGKNFDSGEIKAGASWTRVIKAKGLLNYVCSLHPTMKASLAVKE